MLAVRTPANEGAIGDQLKDGTCARVVADWTKDWGWWR